MRENIRFLVFRAWLTSASLSESLLTHIPGMGHGDRRPSGNSEAHLALFVSGADLLITPRLQMACASLGPSAALSLSSMTWTWSFYSHISPFLLSFPGGQWHRLCPILSIPLLPLLPFGSPAKVCLIRFCV
jgi:hypothetical protein